jgi:hypothetical protein
MMLGDVGLRAHASLGHDRRRLTQRLVSTGLAAPLHSPTWLAALIVEDMAMSPCADVWCMR